MKKLLILFFVIFVVTSCQNDYEAPIPDLSWELFENPDAVKLSSTVVKNLEGIFSITEGVADFGAAAVLKSSYLIENNDTTWHLSLFVQNQVRYFICEGKQLNGSILLNGYWRNQTNTETGRARLTITAENGAGKLLNNEEPQPDSLIITGVYGTGENVPAANIRFVFTRILNYNLSYHILAHRGGGRTADLLPASENSVELIKIASRYGATGVEIDVRMTSDHVPILYHDENLNDRLTQKSGLVGAINNYSYAQLSAFVRLKNGERIPTLREALDAVLYHTPLEIVWMDIKYEGSLTEIRNIQLEYSQKAASTGRDLKIYIGIPSVAVKNNFVQLPDYKNLLSLVELSVDDVRTLEAEIWAPRWTEGLQNTMVMQMQSENREVFTWTIDVAGYAEQYINNGNFNGILSNYPTMIAYYHYVR